MSTTMKAAFSGRYGGPETVAIDHIARPQPGPGELLIRVHASTVSRTDCGMLRGYPIFMRLAEGLMRPKHRVLGIDFAGIVAETGPGVTAFRPGARVFGLSSPGFGAHAEYLCLPQDAPVAKLPDQIAFDAAVLCEGAWYAQTFLNDFGLGPGHRILIYGASGAIGTAAVLLARARGAEVTAVVEPRHLEMAAGLGADRVIDCAAQDFTAIGETFDFVFDAVGKTTYFAVRPLLKDDGRFAATDLGPGWQNLWLSAWFGLTRSRRMRFPLPKDDPAMIRDFAALMQTGKLCAVVDRRYPLEQITDAYEYVESARKAGIVVLDTAPDPQG